MNEPKFTPGPWHCDGFPTIAAKGRGMIAKVLERFMDRSERIANAHLIAASPTLYSALENLCDSIRLADFEGIPQSDLADMEKRFNEALAALDQARGKV